MSRDEARSGDEATLRVLIADDEAMARKRLRRLLAALPNVEVVAECASGDAALSALETLELDVAVLDVQMPGLDGLGLCKSMRSDVELAEIPVVFVSSLALERLHEVADEAGATDYLPKPVALNELLNVVGEYLQQQTD